MAARATLALKAGVWLRRGLLLIVSPVRGYHRRYQAETPLIDLFKFASPALYLAGVLHQDPQQIVFFRRKLHFLVANLDDAPYQIHRQLARMEDGPFAMDLQLMAQRRPHAGQI